jgi:hypothetical protein
MVVGGKILDAIKSRYEVTMLCAGIALALGRKFRVDVG